MAESGPRPWLSDLPGFVRALVSPSDDVWTDPTEELSDEDRETVTALVDLGLDQEAAVTAVREGTVALAIARHQRRTQTKYTIDDLSDRSGVPVSVLEQVQVASGVGVPERYTKADLEWAEALATMLEVMNIETVLGVARAHGAALATIVRTDLSAVRDELVLPLRQDGADDLTIAVALAEASRALTPLATTMLVHGYDRALDHELASELTQLSTASSEVEVPVAIGFVDLVGYTGLSARVDPTGLDRLLDTFERHVVGIVHGIDGVSVVKYLGDAVMLVAARTEVLADTMVRLTAPVAELEDAPLRGGMAYGPTVIREGDFFGTPVNLAARLTDRARPWTVLLQEDAEELDMGDLRLVRTPTIHLRGFGAHQPWSLRAVSAEDDAA